MLISLTMRVEDHSALAGKRSTCTTLLTYVAHPPPRYGSAGLRVYEQSDHFSGSTCVYVGRG